jgi:uncharacterized protein
MSEPSDEMIQVALDLFDAARNGDTVRVLAYVEAGVPVDLTDHQGNTLLMLAAYYGHAALVDGLADRGADVDSLNDRDQVALAGALFKGFDDVVDVLVGRGANLDIGTPTARDAAAMFDRTLPSA